MSKKLRHAWLSKYIAILEKDLNRAKKYPCFDLLKVLYFQYKITLNLFRHKLFQMFPLFLCFLFAIRFYVSLQMLSFLYPESNYVYCHSHAGLAIETLIYNVVRFRNNLTHNRNIRKSNMGASKLKGLSRLVWFGLVWFMVFNATFNNISVIS